MSNSRFFPPPPKGPQAPFQPHTPIKPNISAYATFPSLMQWKTDSCIGTAWTPPKRANDPGLVTIDNLVDAYNRAKTGVRPAGERQYLLGELFFATLHWQNHHMEDKRMKAGRRPAIMRLNFTVTKELAVAFQCTAAEVPERLRNMFGKSLAPLGVGLDTGKTADRYLSSAQREQWRAVFRGGKAYKFSENRDSTAPLELLDTDDYDTLIKMESKPDGRHAQAGFVLSTSDELYVAPLIRKQDSQDAYFTSKGTPVVHSSFMGGRPVQCAGMITFEKGLITQITTESGHYQPATSSLMNVLQLAKSVGMDPKDIQVMGMLGPNTRAHGSVVMHSWQKTGIGWPSARKPAT